MNLKQIQSLARLLETSGLSMIEVCEGDTKIRLEKQITAPAQPAPEKRAASAELPAAAVGPVDEPVNFNRISEVKSPMVGVFYCAPSPESEPFVRVGSRVKKGDTLCIIEAMKLMNEITAEADGEIVDICINNGDIVEFGQTLLKLY